MLLLFSSKLCNDVGMHFRLCSFYSQLPGFLIQNCAYCKAVRMYCFLLLTTETIVAVPISITIDGTGHSFNPATASATRSAPQLSGVIHHDVQTCFYSGFQDHDSFFEDLFCCQPGNVGDLRDYR